VNGGAQNGEDCRRRCEPQGTIALHASSLSTTVQVACLKGIRNRCALEPAPELWLQFYEHRLELVRYSANQNDSWGSRKSIRQNRELAMTASAMSGKWHRYRCLGRLLADQVRCFNLSCGGSAHVPNLCL